MSEQAPTLLFGNFGPLHAFIAFMLFEYSWMSERKSEYHQRDSQVQNIIQWPFQEPKLEVPTIYKAYFLGLNFREYPHNSYGLKNILYGTNVPPSIGSWRSPIESMEYWGDVWSFFRVANFGSTAQVHHANSTAAGAEAQALAPQGHGSDWTLADGDAAVLKNLALHFWGLVWLGGFVPTKKNLKLY